MNVEILELYKKMGETPLETITRYRGDNPTYKDTKMTYLGRLDPMAEGLLLVLAGPHSAKATRDKNTLRKEDFLALDKTYEFDVLWGFKTDTLDILGKVTEVNRMPLEIEKRMSKILEEIKKKKVQKYPAYSSRTVGGKPLFEWARENKIEEIDIPERQIKIFNIEHIDTRLVISQQDILEEIIQKVNLVVGDFRQEEIIQSWKESINPDAKALISSFRADVSSGTYIRGLAETMGEILGNSGIAYVIKRTRVGEYKLDKDHVV